MNMLLNSLFLAMLAAWLQGGLRRSVGHLVHHFGPDWLIAKTIQYISMQFDAYIHVVIWNELTMLIPWPLD